MQYSIVIATHNRARDLEETLASLASLRPDGAWEVLVVDNNSTDDTRAVVERAAATFPAALHCLQEPVQVRDDIRARKMLEDVAERHADQEHEADRPQDAGEEDAATQGVLAHDPIR